MLVEDMSRNKCFSRFKYHTFYILCPYVTYLLTLPLTSQVVLNLKAQSQVIKVWESTQTKVQNPKIKLLSIHVRKATRIQLDSMKFLEISKVNISEDVQDISAYVSGKLPTEWETHPHVPSGNGKVQEETAVSA
jgi:hypothetical protein